MRHMELGRGRCKESLLSRALARDAFLKKDAKKTKSHNEYVPNGLAVKPNHSYGLSERPVRTPLFFLKRKENSS